jgi:hypothetical protein
LASLLSIVCSLLVGGVLVVVPWTPWWEVSYLLPPHPAVRGILLSAFTRGAVSGLGLVNIVIALYDAHEQMAGRDQG